MATKKELFLNTPGVKEKLQEIADKHGFSIDELINVIQKESNFDLSIKNGKGSGATGLIQFMPNTAKDLGTTTEAIANMDALDQLNVVDKFFSRNHKKGTHPYLTVAYPKAARMEGDAIIAKKNSTMAKQNPLWLDENGNITPDSIVSYADPSKKSNTKPDEKEAKIEITKLSKAFVKSPYYDAKLPDEVLNKKFVEFAATYGGPRYLKYATVFIAGLAPIGFGGKFYYESVKNKSESETPNPRKGKGDWAEHIEKNVEEIFNKGKEVQKADEYISNELDIKNKTNLSQSERAERNKAWIGKKMKEFGSNAMQGLHAIKSIITNPDSPLNAVTDIIVNNIEVEAKKAGWNKEYEDAFGPNAKKRESVSPLEGAKKGLSLIDIEKKATIASKKAIDDGKSKEEAKAIADAIRDEQNAKKMDSYNKKLNDWFDTQTEPTPPTERFNYDKKDFKKGLPIDALAQGALGLIGLAQADNELPLREYKENAATLAYLEETKRIISQGLPPDMEAKAKRDLTESFGVGLETLTRASGGNRNLILANTGALDSNKAKAIVNLAIADEQMKNQAFAQYGETLGRMEAEKQKIDAINHQIKYDEARQQRAEGKALANSGFSSMMEELAYQRENGPGSANDMFRKQIEMQMFGQVFGMKDNGKGDTPGTASHKAKIDKQNFELYAKSVQKSQLQEKGKAILNSMSRDQKLALEDMGFNPATVDWAKVDNIDQLMAAAAPKQEYSYEDFMNGKPLEAPMSPKVTDQLKGYAPVNIERWIDGDTAVVDGETIRLVGEGGVPIDARENGQPGGTGIRMNTAYKDADYYMKKLGPDVYNRGLGQFKMVDNNTVMDPAIMQGRFDPVHFPNYGKYTLESIKMENANPFFGTEPNVWGKENQPWRK